MRRTARIAVFRAAGPQPKLVRPWILETLEKPSDEEELLLALYAGVLHLSPDAGTERALAAHAANPSVAVRTWVARRLAAEVGADSLDLLKQLAKEQAPVGAAAAVSLAKRGVWDPPVGEMIAEIARDGDPLPRFGRRNLRAGGGLWTGPPPVARWDWWILALKPLRASGANALPAFESAFDGASEEQRVNLAHALGYIGEDAIPLLTARLDDESLEVRYAAAMTLTVFGPRGISGLPELLRILERSTRHPPLHDAILNLGPAAVPGLVRAYDAKMRAAHNAEHDGIVALPCSSIPELIRGMGEKGTDALDRAVSTQDLHPQTREELARLRKRMAD